MKQVPTAGGWQQARLNCHMKGVRMPLRAQPADSSPKGLAQ